MPTKKHTFPGTMLVIAGCGVYIKGPAKIGKSTLAIELIHRGHQLVSDDTVTFYQEGENLMAEAPSKLQGVVHHPALGLLEINTIFGSSSLIHKTPVHLVIEVVSSITNTSLTGTWQTIALLDTQLPSLILDKQSLAHPILTELAVKQYQKTSKKGTFRLEHPQKLRENEHV